MDRGAWWATVHGTVRVRHNWVTSTSLSLLNTNFLLFLQNFSILAIVLFMFSSIRVTFLNILLIKNSNASITNNWQKTRKHRKIVTSYTLSVNVKAHCYFFFTRWEGTSSWTQIALFPGIRATLQDQLSEDSGVPSPDLPLRPAHSAKPFSSSSYAGQELHVCFWVRNLM